jgi:hypothetical protein
MKKKIFLLSLKGWALIISLCVVASCANNVPITKEDRSKITIVAIDKNVSLPEEPYIQGGNSRLAFLLAGGIGVAAEGMSAGKAFIKYMEKNNIDLGKIVITCFEENIKKDNILPLRDDGIYKLSLKVNVFGYVESRFLGLVTPKVYRKPIINIKATITNAENKIIWQKTAYNQSDKTTEYEFIELSKKPEKTIASLKEVTTLVAAEIMDDLRNN